MEEEEPELKYTCTQNKNTLHIFEKAKVKIKTEVGISDPIREEHKSDYRYINNKMMLDKLKESEEKRDDIKTRIKLEREEVNYKEKEVTNSAKVCIKREFDGQQTQDDGISESKIPFLDKSKVFSEQSENDNVNIATGNTKISNIKIIEKSKLGANGNNTSYRSIINMANLKAGNISKSNTNSGSNTAKYTSLLANRPLGVNVIQSKTSREDKSSSDSGSLSGISGRENIVIEVGKSFNSTVSSQGIDRSNSRSAPSVTALNKIIIDSGDSPKNPVSFLVVNGSNSGSSSSAPAVKKVVIDTVKSANNSGLVKSTDGSDQKIKYRSILDKVNNKSNSSNSSQNMDQSVSGSSSSGNTTASKIVIDADKSHYNSLLAQNADGSTKKVKYRSILNPSNGKPSVASNTNFSKESDMQNENVYSTFVDSKPDEADLEFYNPTNFNVLVNRVGGEIRIKMVDSMPLDESKSSKCNKNNNDDNEDSEIDEFSEDNQVGDAEEGSETHACNFCAKLFPTTEKLEEHSMQHSVKDFYQCFICKERFLFDDDLKEHFSVHTLEKPYKCDVCEKKFTSKSGLNMHKLIHTGDKPYPCQICGKEFTRATVLRRHQRVHTGEKLFQCEECGKHYANSFSLGQHKLIHTGERPHKCEECGKQFRLSNGLRRHMLLHTGEKPHCCYFCGRNFRQSTQLKNHKCLSLKSNVEFFECPDCGEKFRETSLLHVHMAAHSG